MPPTINLPEELARVDAQLSVDSTHRFSIASKVNAPTYRKLVQDAMSCGIVLSHMIERALTEFYAECDFQPTTMEALKALSVLWEADLKEVIRKVVESTAYGALQQEVSMREAVKNLTLRATQASRVADDTDQSI